MAIEILLPLLAGMGIPALTQWMKGGIKSFKKEKVIREVAFASLVGLGVAYVAFLVANPPPQPAAVAQTAAKYDGSLVYID